MNLTKKLVLPLVAAVALAALARAGAAETKPSEAGTPAPRAQSFSLSKGYRGVSLKVPLDQVEFLKKNDRVDALVTFDAIMDDGKKEKVTATILQDVGVLEVAKTADHGVVELIVNPNEAEYSVLSQYQGELSLVRRAPGDTEMHPMEMASLRKLFK